MYTYWLLDLDPLPVGSSGCCIEIERFVVSVGSSSDFSGTTSAAGRELIAD